MRVWQPVCTCTGPDPDSSHLAPACAAPWTSVGLFLSKFDEYHIVLCITHRLSIKTVIHQQRGLQAYVSYVRGSWLWGPPFPSSPIASNSCPICFLYPQSHCFKFLPTLGSALPSSPLCGLWEAIWGCIFKRQCFLRNTQYMQNSKLANFFPFFPLFCFFFLFLFALWKIEGKENEEKFQFSDQNWIWKKPPCITWVYFI